MTSLRRRRRAGFTLLELIAVIAVVGLIAALAVGRLDFLVPKYRLRGAAREVGAVLKQAKSRAAATGRDVYFMADLGQGEYWLLVAFPKLKDDGTLPGPGEPTEFEYQEAFRSTLPDGVQFVNVVTGPGNDQSIGGGRAVVRMSPFGASASVIVNLRMDDLPMCTKLNGITGVVTFYEEHQQADELLEAPSD